MKVIHFSALDTGGAGIAAYRYHKLMQEMGFDSKLYVSNKTIEDDSIIKIHIPISKSNTIKQKVKNIIRNTLFKFLPEIELNETNPMFCFYNFNECKSEGLIPDLLSQIDTEGISFVFIHWLGGFLNSYDIKKIYEKTGAKFLFAMMDLEPITGGCHYPWICNKYETNCLNCPALSNYNNLLAHNQLMTKATNYAYLNADIFSSALYDLEFAKKSIIKFKKYYQLYYPIDDTIFVPSKIKTIKNEITLFANVNTVEDPRKGFNYLLLILLKIDRLLTHKVKFLCLSNEKYSGYNFKNIQFEEFAFCQNVNDLVSLYQKTDIFLCASIEDSAPMMLQEALLCGVPAITFDVGIGKQFIEDGKQGYVVPRYDVDSFAEKLLTMIENCPDSIETSEQIHNHMVSICGKKAVSNQLNTILLN